MSTKYDTLIIDGNNFLFRAFFTKRPQKLVDDINVTPIHQFLSMFKSVSHRFKPNEIILTWDKKLNSTKKNFRKNIVAYKEQRVENEKTNELFNTISHIQKFIDALGIKTVYPVNMEADDVIRYLSVNNSKKGLNSLIISSDKDLLQLIDSHVSVYLPSKDIIVNDENFESLINLQKHLFVLYKSILGDVSDNIEGLDKFGIVRAKALAEKIYTEDGIDYQKGNLNQEQIDIINRNLSVVDLSRTEQVYPDEYDFYKNQEDEFDKKFDSELLKDLFKDYDFPLFLKSFGEWNTLFNKNIDTNDLLSCISM